MVSLFPNDWRTATVLIRRIWKTQIRFELSEKCGLSIGDLAGKSTELELSVRCPHVESGHKYESWQAPVNWLIRQLNRYRIDFSRDEFIFELILLIEIDCDQVISRNGVRRSTQSAPWFVPIYLQPTMFVICRQNHPKEMFSSLQPLATSMKLEP